MCLGLKVSSGEDYVIHQIIFMFFMVGSRLVYEINSIWLRGSRLGVVMVSPKVKVMVHKVLD